MAAPTFKQSLLVHFGANEAIFAVTRKTVKDLRVRLGFSNDTQVVLYALATLRDSVMPRYEMDDGPIPDAVVRRIRKTVRQNMRVSASLL